MENLLSNAWTITIAGGTVGTILSALIIYFVQKRATPSLLGLYKQAFRVTCKELMLTHEERHILRKVLTTHEVVETIKTEALGPAHEVKQLCNTIAKLTPSTSRFSEIRFAATVVDRLLYEELKIEGRYSNYHIRTYERRSYFESLKANQDVASIHQEKELPLKSLSPSIHPVIRTFFTRPEYLQGVAENCIGREQDLKKLYATLTTSAIRLIIVEGFGGIGKTTIVAQFALYAADTYNILWIECRGISVTTERLLLEIAHLATEQYKFPWLQATVENPALSETEKISGLIEFLSSTDKSHKEQPSDKTLLPLALFFDDYHLIMNIGLNQLIEKITESHVNVKVVLVTRKLPRELQNKTTTDNSVLLDGLALEDCRTFITSYTKKFPALKQVDEAMLYRIWTRTGKGVPTALKILASMTRTRSLQDILQQLPDYDTLTSAAHEWFSSLFDELSMTEQQVAKEASIFRRPISRSILRQISRGIQIDGVIDELVDRFVLMFDGLQYSMHALWSEYTQEILTSTEKKEFHTRAAILYRDLEADERFTQVMSKVESCYHFIKAENLEEAVEVILPIANTLRFWGVYRELLDILNKVEAFARRINQPMDPRLRIQQCAALHASGQVELAITALNELIETSTGEIEITALQELGWICAETGDNQKAELLLLHSLELARQQGLHKLEGEALFKLQYNAYHVSKLKECLQYNTQRLEIFQKIKDDPEAQEVVAWIYHDIGSVYRELGHYEEALKLYLQSLDFWSTVESSPYRAALLYYDVGQIYRDQGKYQKALQMTETAHQLYTKINYLYGIAHTKTELGRIGNRFDQTSQPIKQVEEAILIMHQVKAPTGEAYSLNALGDIYLSRKQPEQALPYLQQSLAINTPLNNTKDMARSLHHMSLAYEQQGEQLFTNNQQKEARTHFEAALEKITQAKEMFTDPQLISNFEGIDTDTARIRNALQKCDEPGDLP